MGYAGKKTGQFIKEWDLAKTKDGSRVFITTTISIEKANKLEELAPIMLGKKWIESNSAFAVARYLLEKGADSIEIALKQQILNETQK